MQNSNKFKMKYSNAMKVDKKEQLYNIPIMLIMGVLPLISKYVQYNPRLANFYWYGKSEVADDLYLFWKQIFLILVATICVVLLLAYYKREGIKKVPIYLYLLGGYQVLIVLSTVVSPYRYWGFVGGFEHFESMFAHLSYFVIVLYCITFIKKEEQINRILKFFLGGILVILTIGTFQGLKLDFINSKVGMMLIFPYEIWSNLKSFTTHFIKGTVYMTLYNPNYVGVYLAMIIPVIVAMFFYFKNKYMKVGIVIVLGMALFSLKKSGSEAGMITVILFAIFSIIFLSRSLFKNKRIYYGLLCSLIIFIGFLGWMNKSKIKNIFVKDSVAPKLESIETKERLIIRYNGQVLKINYNIINDDYIFWFQDVNDDYIEHDYNEEEYYYSVDLEGMEDIKIQTGLYNEQYALKVLIDRKQWFFTNQTDDGSFYYINDKLKMAKIEEAEAAFSARYNDFATGRGFLWSKTIPLLEKHILLGSGAESFVFSFPHSDYVSLHNSRFGNEIVNKPHNLYLQIGIESGVFSLVFFIGFFVIYLKDSFKLYWNYSVREWRKKIGFALFISVLSYLFVSLTNDSFITVTPVFWCIVGLSLVVNKVNGQEV